jgi:hypothetical protein
METTTAEFVAAWVLCQFAATIIFLGYIVTRRG